MFTEIIDLWSSIDRERTSSGGTKVNVNLNRNRIRSISAYSSNSIFYFPTIVSDQITPEESGMIIRMVEKAYASFVVACISLMPFHRIRADDQASIEEYLKQFHQNIGINAGSGAMMSKVFGLVDSMNETASPEDLAEVGNFLYGCWQESVSKNTDFVKLVSETVSLNDMFQVDPIDPKTRLMKERFERVNEEVETWGFVGEAYDSMLDTDDDALMDVDDEQLLAELLDDDEDDDDFEGEVSDDDIWGHETEDLNEAVGDGVKKAIDSIKFAIESVSDNKIKSCQSLTKLSTLENKLKKLKNKYTKYLNRYKNKWNENKKSGSRSKLAIRFNNLFIENPKTFMRQYGAYIKVINKKLKLVEARRAELRKRKGIPAGDSQNESANPMVDLTDLDLRSIEFCCETVDSWLTAPDSEVFLLLEDAEDDERIERLSRAYGHSEERRQAAEKKAAASAASSRSFQKMYADSLKSGAKAQKELERTREELKTAQDRSAQQRLDRRAQARSNGGSFDREVFTNMDLKKANEAIPTFTKASIGFIVEDTDQVITRDVLVGIKAYLHKAPATELISDVYNAIINKRKFLKFIKFVTGEERSLADLLFGFKELRNDALDSKGQAGQWRAAFKRRQRWSKIAVPYLMREYTPNGTLVLTMNEVNFIKDQYGIDVMTPDHVRMIMESDYLLGFVVVDQADEMVYVTYDGHGYQFQQYTYAMLEREQQSNERALREIYRAMNR